MRVQDEVHTVGDFFVNAVQPRLSYECGRVQSAFVGPDKNSLDYISDDNLPVELLVESFGHYIYT